MTTQPLTHKTGAAGVALLHHLSSAAGFVSRGLGGFDLGIDAAVEVFDAGISLGQVLIKVECTGNHRNVNSCSIGVSNAPTLLAYWRSLRSPVIVLQALLDSAQRDSHDRDMAVDAYGIDVSHVSIRATGSTISWADAGSSELRLEGARSEGSVDKFKAFLIRVSRREPAGTKANALWLSNRALDAADYDAAEHAIAAFLDDKLPWAVVQQHRINRRKNDWLPSDTEEALKAYAEDVDSEDGRRALQEIGYSYLVGAMDSWCARKEGVSGKYDEADYCRRALGRLSRWATHEQSGWDGYNYMLYVHLACYVMGIAASCSDANSQAERLVLWFKTADRSIDLRAIMTLWRHALVMNDSLSATRYMNKAWPAFAFSGDLPDCWSERSAQMFADAMVLRSGTLSLTGAAQTHYLLDAAYTAIRGFLRYREIEFWIHATSKSERKT